LLPEWHDSYVFDVVRKEFNSFKCNNLSENIDGLNVWENTILGEYMIHNKGNLKDD
jgi:spore coat protein CotF